MKNKLLIILLIFASLSSYASDKLENEVVCSKITHSGEADSGLDIIIQSNLTSWAKRVSIVEDGYVGRLEIGSFLIPIKPENNFDIQTGESETYRAKDFQLTMQVLSTRIEQNCWVPLELFSDCRAIDRLMNSLIATKCSGLCLQLS